MTSLTKYETETIVNYSVGEQAAIIDKTYSMPKFYVTYRKPRIVSNEQREQTRQRTTKLNSLDN